MKTFKNATGTTLTSQLHTIPIVLADGREVRSYAGVSAFHVLGLADAFESLLPLSLVKIR